MFLYSQKSKEKGEKMNINIHKIIKIKKEKIHPLNNNTDHISTLFITYLDFRGNEQEIEISLFSDKPDNLKIKNEN